MYTLDRFARNRYDSAIYKAKLKKNGVRVYYAKQPMPDTPEGIILESVLEGYAEYYSENLARNIKRGIRENALQGLATGGANLLLGYTVGEDRKYAIDPTGAKIVQEIFQLYADGMSATQIIAYCNERGYKTARGNAFNKNSLRTILRNEKYIGTYKLMDIVIPDGMPAIIDNVLFEKVQAMLKHNGKARAKAKAHENYLLTTKLFCGHCGSPMVGESGTSKTGQVHYYYKCTKAKREHACKKKSERKDWIEKLVVRYTVQNVLTDENIALIAKRAMEIIEKESADTTYLDGLNAELKDVQKKIKNLVSAIEQGIITSATKDRLDELEQEKSDIEGRIAREEMKKPLLNESRIRYWLTSFKSGNVDDEDYQRRVIDTLVNSVYVYDDEDGGKRIVLTFNLSGNNTATLTSSDIGCYAPPDTKPPSRGVLLFSRRRGTGYGYNSAAYKQDADDAAAFGRGVRAVPAGQNNRRGQSGALQYTHTGGAAVYAAALLFGGAQAGVRYGAGDERIGGACVFCNSRGHVPAAFQGGPGGGKRGDILQRGLFRLPAHNGHVQ